MGNKNKNGIQIVLLRGLRQAVVLHVGHEALTKRSTTTLQIFGTGIPEEFSAHSFSSSYEVPPEQFQD